MQEIVNDWRLTEASQESDRIGGNYVNPHRQWIYVNIRKMNIDIEQYRSQFNNHRKGTEKIEMGNDFDDVYQAAVEWMEENPPTDGKGGGRQQALSSF